MDALILCVIIMEEDIIISSQPIEHELRDDGTFPNNDALPLIYYRGALNLPKSRAASAIEKIFKKNKWVNSWRNGIYDYHHYHSTAHEVLGIYSGHATVQMGGPAGIKLNLNKGDVIIIPAGVAHKNLGSSEDFKCVGAYPHNAPDYDMNYGKPGERPGTIQNIQKVPLPDTDPVYGTAGDLLAAWNKRS